MTTGQEPVRVGMGLEAEKTSGTCEAIAAGVADAAAALPDDVQFFFEALACAACRLLPTTAAYVSVQSANRPDTLAVSAFALKVDGEPRIVEHDMPPLRTPVISAGRDYHQRQLAAEFPQHPYVRDLGLQHARVATLRDDLGCLVQIGILSTAALPDSPSGQRLATLARSAGVALGDLPVPSPPERLTSRTLEQRYHDDRNSVLVIHEHQQRTVFANQRLGDLVGLSPASIVGKRCSELAFWSDYASLGLLCNSARRLGRVSGRLIQLQHNSGDLRQLMTQITTIRVDGVAALALEMHDVTDYSSPSLEADLDKIRLNTLSESINDAMLVVEVRKDGSISRIVDANPLACRRLRMRFEQLLSLQDPARKLFALPGSSSLREHVLRGIRGGNSEFRAVERTLHGEVLDVVVSMRSLPVGAADQLLLVSRDVSSRQHLDLQQHWLVGALDASRDGLAILDSRLRFRYLNRAHQKLFGYAAREACVGRSLDSFARERQKKRFADDIIPALKRDGSWFGQVMACAADGSNIPLELALSRLHSGDYVCVVRDIRERIEQQRRLAEAEINYRGMFQKSPHGIYQMTPAGRLISANPALLSMLGYADVGEVHSAVGDFGIGIFIDEDARSMVLRHLMRAGEIENIEQGIRRCDGRVLWITENARLIRDRDGDVQLVEGTLSDITARRRAEQALIQSEKKFRGLIENNRDGMVILVNQIIKYSNQAMAKLTGEPIDNLLNKPFADLIAAEERMRLNPRSPHPIRLNGPNPSAFQTSLERRDGTRSSDVEVHTAPIRFLGQAGMSVTVHDITEQCRVEKQLAHNALHDPLTDLPNRKLFIQQLNSAIDRHRMSARQPDFALLFLDLDDFKLVNDGLGHGVGDKLLVLLAQRLKLCVNEHGLISRHGGDEFTVLLRGLQQLAEAETVARKILRALREPFTFDDKVLYTSCSIGIATPLERTVTADGVLRDADIAMYRAKAAGKGRFVVFNRPMRRAAQNRLTLETQLREATVQQQFQLYYQPIVSLHNGSLYGFESLLRWVHPTRGLIAPADFIDVAEETGLIVKISANTLRNALAQLATWHRQYPEVPPPCVSINISNRQFAIRDLAQQLHRTIAGAAIDPHFVHVEITEKVFMADPHYARHVLDNLKQLGVVVMLDDFGTGFSSLSALRNLPIDILKIDRSFVRHIDTDPRDQSVVRTILDLAAEFNMEVVAEGIENARQARWMQELGCQYGQGYYYGAPAPPDVVEVRLKQT